MFSHLLLRKTGVPGFDRLQYGPVLARGQLLDRIFFLVSVEAVEIENIDIGTPEYIPAPPLQIHVPGRLRYPRVEELVVLGKDLLLLFPYRILIGLYEAGQPRELFITGIDRRQSSGLSLNRFSGGKDLCRILRSG